MPAFSSLIASGIMGNFALDDPAGLSDPLKKLTDPITGASATRAARDSMSEAKGAQRAQIKALEDKAVADQQSEANRAQSNALRRQAKQGGGGLGYPGAPLPVIKTLLGS